MRRTMKWSALLPACLALILTTGAARAREDKPAAGPRGKLDDAVYANLKEVINHGANLYNTGDWNGCYRLWKAP